MFRVYVKRKAGRTLLGTYPELDQAKQAALDWVCKEAHCDNGEALNGSWLGVQVEEEHTWFFVPEISALDALGWILPGCEIRGYL